jgi:hypothetical protein
MHYKDNFEDATSRLTHVHSLLYNSGFYCSERDFDLAQKLKQLLNDIADSRCYYDENGNLKEKSK